VPYQEPEKFPCRDHIYRFPYTADNSISWQDIWQSRKTQGGKELGKVGFKKEGDPKTA